MVGEYLPLTASCLRGSWASGGVGVGVGGGGCAQKKSLILGLSHWVCRVNPHAGPSVVLLPSDVTAQGLAAATETREGAGLVPHWHLLNSVM